MFLNTFKLFNEESIPTCTISVFVIMLQFTVHIENIHVASTISQDNQLQAWKLAEQQNRPCTSVSASGKSSGKLIMANRSQLKFPFERGTFKQVFEFIQVVKKKLKSDLTLLKCYRCPGHISSKWRNENLFSSKALLTIAGAKIKFHNKLSPTSS